MSIQAPQGILNIPNATLRVGKLAVNEVGCRYRLNTIARNTILLVDGETYHENKNWGLKLPNAWAGEFECNTASAGNYSEFNFYNEGASSNAQGYNLTFNDTAAELRYDGTLLTSGTLPSTVTGTGVKKVRLMFERTILSVTVDGTLIFTHDDTGGPRPRVYSTTAGGFLNFFTDGGALKNLKIVNEKWISDGTSNIAYVGGGEVAVGKALAFNRVSNVSQIKVDSNVVTEYTGPHDRPLRKYPEVAMTANDNSSTSGYVANASSSLTASQPYINFDGNLASHWHSRYPYYSTSTGAYSPGTAGDGQSPSGTLATNELVSGHQGEWVSIELPKKIKLEKLKVIGSTRLAESPPKTQFPKDVVVAVSETGLSGSWSVLETATLISQNVSNHSDTINITTQTSYYKYFALIVKSINSTASYSAVEIAELEFYGHEEGSGSLDTTLKTVYNVPATTGTQLEVYYDGRDLDNGAVTSVSGLGGTTIGGTAYGDPQISDGAFVFDGTGDAIQTAATSFTGNAIFTASLWVKLDRVTDSTSQNVIFAIGYDGTQTQSGIRVNEGTGKFRFYTQSGTGSLDTEVTAVTNTWYHLNLVHNASSGYQLYINGEMVGETFTDDLNLASNSTVGLGAAFASSGTINSGTLPFKGSIANFRLYSKALNAGQVQELYDYQKDYFLGSKSQVTLYKGHLGVGVTEPSGQLELAGDERIQEYPPRGFGVFAEDPDYSTHIEGHGVFTAYGSSQDNTGKSYSVIGAFDKTVSPDNSCWLSATNTYSGGLPASSAAKINGVSGEWCALQCPYPIKLQSFTTRVRSASSGENGRMAKSGIIWGSNDGATWYQVHSWGGRVYSDTNSNYFEVNSTEYYSHHAFQATELQGSSTATTLGEWRLFGTPGPTTLDKGSLTLGRSLDVPRISRYDVDTETPRPEKLVLDFDTTVNSSPTDISGKGNHGRFVGNAQYSASDKAFKFDGEDAGPADYIIGNLNNTGDTDFTVSLWLKKDRSGTAGMLCNFGGSGGSGNPEDSVGLEVGSNNNLNYFIYSGAEGFISNFAVTYLNRWVHIVATRSGNNLNVYLDGVDQNFTTTGSDTLQLAANTEYTIGARGTGSLGTSSLSGYISNFKVYDVALEPSEVKKLYNLGRTGRSMVISDTAVGIGKVPEAQLDVRGNLKVSGSVGINTTSPSHDLQIDGSCLAREIRVHYTPYTESFPGGNGGDSDGVLSRPDGQVYITVDDAFYMRDNVDTSTNRRHYFDTNTGNIRYEGNLANQNLDYAELFEWYDGNPNGEDRVGYTVTLVEGTNKIKKMEVGDTPLGVVSAAPGVVGGQGLHWHGYWEKDDWGRPVYAQQLIRGEPVFNEDGTPKMKRVKNPDYDVTLEESYLPRDKRQEWSCIGLLGQVYIRKECVKSPHWRKIKDVDDVKELWLINTVIPDQAEKAKVASLEARISALEQKI
jgi:hypothetical protein